MPEAALAQSLGVARDDLKKLRAQKLAAGVDWTGGAGAPILITTAGQDKLQRLLSACDSTVSDAAAQGEDRYSSLTVDRVAGARILLARRPDQPPDAPPERVIVRDSTNFTPGMVIAKCEPSTRVPGTWYYHGRLPRSKGRF